MANSKFDEMFGRLPTTIKETAVLRLPTKKVLAALLDLLLHSEARESRIIYCQNARLRKLSGVSSNDLLPSIQQLIDYDLITRKAGTARQKGETKGQASEYTINMKKLKEPLIEKSFDDLFGEFLDDVESLEKPIDTTITTSISNSIKNTNTIENTTINSIITENTNSTSLQVQNQNQPELEKNNNYRDLEKYFEERLIEECEDRNIEELNEIQESSKDELDSFNDSKESEQVESKENKAQHQNTSIETPSENSASTNEQTYIPNAEEERVLTELTTLIRPYIAKVLQATSIRELDNIVESMSQKANEYSKTANMTDWVVITFNEWAKGYISIRLKELQKKHDKEIERQVQQSSWFC